MLTMDARFFSTLNMYSCKVDLDYLIITFGAFQSSGIDEVLPLEKNQNAFPPSSWMTGALKGHPFNEHSIWLRYK